MRQRVMIARPRLQSQLLIADEPTTALDVTIQAQILELMKDLSRRLGIAVVLITHNLGIVARYADQVNVMYAARLVESGTAGARLCGAPASLLARAAVAVPRLDRGRSAKLATIDGAPPNLLAPPTGSASARAPVRNPEIPEDRPWCRPSRASGRLHRIGDRGPGPALFES